MASETESRDHAESGEEFAADGSPSDPVAPAPSGTEASEAILAARSRRQLLIELRRRLVDAGVPPIPVYRANARTLALSSALVGLGWTLDIGEEQIMAMGASDTILSVIDPSRLVRSGFWPEGDFAATFETTSARATLPQLRQAVLTRLQFLDS